MPADSNTPAATSRAVFLSYAREDTGVARRIADALRGFGVEVWFDQHELRGGDAWDAKIRHQIRGCALFVPVISASTQARGEGYFRREWKVAVDRTHDMHEAVPFIVPVVVDGTAESSALVPEPFLRVQWTRLPGGVPNPQFVEQVKRLLEPPARSVASEADPAHRPPIGGVLPPAAPESNSSLDPRLPAWMWAAVVIIALGVVAAWYFLHNRAIPAPEAKAAAMPAESPPVPAVTPLSGKSIAVLPFANFSPDQDNEFFADGMHDEVITALAKIHDLKVISRTSVMAYKNPEGRNLKKIAAELGVANVLEGSVQRAGNRAKVIVQLIDARTDQHLWAETYTEDVTDVFTIQSKLAGAITTALKATLSPEEKSLIERRPTENQEAYDLFLRARAMNEAITSSGGETRESLDRVAALYEQAIAKDPKFAAAYVQLSVTRGLQYWFGYLDPTPARRARAKEALDAALRLAPDAPETRVALGNYSYTCENDWARALAEYRAAEAGLPNDAQLIYFIGLAQRRLGRLTDAIVSFTRAVELNPRDADGAVAQIEMLFYLRHFAAVRELATGYAALFSNNPNVAYILAATQLELEHDRAAYVRRIEAISPGPIDPYGLAQAYRIALIRGDLAAAERALADARLSFVPDFGNVINDPVPLHRALVAFLLGQTEAARTFADEAVAAYRAQSWAPRQEPRVMSHVALAHALAGRADEAVRLAREGFTLQTKRDAWDAAIQRGELAQVYLVLNRREEALAVLREMMTEPGFGPGPEQMRLDPLWSRLKDDPRFEEILKSAKPL